MASATLLTSFFVPAPHRQRDSLLFGVLRSAVTASAEISSSDIHFFCSHLAREIIRAKNILPIPGPQ